MIPRAQLFGNPRQAAANMSPDGRWLSWAEADPDGVMNLWVAPAEDRANAHRITDDRRRGVVGHSWAYDSLHVLYGQDQDGDENYQLYAVNVVSGEHRCLTPFPGTRSAVVTLSRQHRNEILISQNRRDPRFADLYVLDLSTAEMTLVLENPGMEGFIVDEDYVPMFASRPVADGSEEWLRRDRDGQWQVWDRIGVEDTRSSSLSHLSRDGRYLYLYDSRGRDTAALVEVDLHAADSRRVLATSPLADVAGGILDGETLRPLACSINYERHELRLLDDRLRPDVEFLDAQDFGEWGIVARTEDDRRWLLGTGSDTHPGATYLYERDDRRLNKLYDLRPELAGYRLARMQPITVTSRDGLPLVSYLSLPVAFDSGEPLQATTPAPLVLLVHGGPWARDSFGYNTMHQWLCDRGYAVLSVNFRGSTGFGKRFINAGDGEWGRRMDDDLDDVVDWAIGRGLVDPKRMAIVGGSYGGYAVLSALTRQPGRYTCGVDIVGPSNLETLMRAIPPHWEAARTMLYRAVGNPETEEGRKLLRERSPLHVANAIRDPLLIAQGANDPRVPQAESDSMVQALVERGIPVEYALFPDEGHGFDREPNRLVFNAWMEAFLARHLGGALEPFTLDDFPGNTLQILHGDTESSGV